MTETAPVYDTQVGGNHYRDMPIQPAEFIIKNGIGFAEGNAIKYLCRWRKKGGIEDLRKARHYIEMLIAEAGQSVKKTDTDIASQDNPTA